MHYRGVSDITILVNPSREIQTERILHLMKTNRKLATRNARGFTMLELLIVVAVVGILAAITLPSINDALAAYRLNGDARSIADQLALVRLRAADNFSQARLNFNLVAGTYVREICTTKGVGSACTTWTAEGGTQYLSSGNSFGFNNISTPAPPQTTITQPVGLGNPAQNVIIFNSRGLPVDGNGNPTASYALYLTSNPRENCAVSVYGNGKVRRWKYYSNTWNTF
jgi:prepilin-type N-terminal cleavage/methylation domain-containing protein